MSIYIHIPFCKKACHYCNFHFSTTRYRVDEMTEAICKEIQLQKDYISQPLNSIYFGGGTPSILDEKNIEKILCAIHETFNVNADAEITLEANPDDITTEKLSSWKAFGINRLSIGIQSFFEDDLHWMNRVHNKVQAIQSILNAQQTGFENLTIDLIYGMPTLDDDKWLKNINTAIDLGIQHLSCYALTVESKTALHKFIEKNKVPNIDQEQQSRQFELLMKAIADKGFEQYEISNFAKKGYRSRHNSNYWSGNPYLGIGPGAHSFNGYSRQWNVSNNAIYLRKINEGVIPFEKEILSEENKINEYIMTSLRMIEGIDLEKIKNNFGENISERILNDAEKYFQKNWLQKKENHLTLTTQGKLMADGIAADLFA